MSNNWRSWLHKVQATGWSFGKFPDYPCSIDIVWAPDIGKFPNVYKLITEYRRADSRNIDIFLLENPYHGGSNKLKAFEKIFTHAE